MKKLLYAIIVVLLITAVIGAMGYLTDGFKNWTFEQFAKKNDVSEDNKTAVAIDGDGNAMYEGEEYVLPSAMTFLSDSNGTTQTITATVIPATAFSQLEWTISWGSKGENYVTSDWLTDKNVTDYVSMTVSEDTSSVSLCYIRPFYYKINVVAKSVVNDNLNATCVIECKARPRSMDLFSVVDIVDSSKVYYSAGENDIPDNVELRLPYGEMFFFRGIGASIGTKFSINESVKSYVEYDIQSYIDAFGEDNIDSSKGKTLILYENTSSLLMAPSSDSSNKAYFLHASQVLKGSAFTSSNTKMFCEYVKAHSDFVVATLVIELNVDDFIRTYRIPIRVDMDSINEPTNLSLDKETITF